MEEQHQNHQERQPKQMPYHKIQEFQMRKKEVQIEKMFKYPSSKTMAEFHRNSNKMGRRVNLKTVSKQERQKMKKACPCCDNIYVFQEFTLCEQTWAEKPADGHRLFRLPSGISLYFTFLKMVILFLLLRFLIFDVATIILSLNGSYCPNQFKHLGKMCAFTTSGYNLNSIENQDQLNILDILSLVLTVLSIVFLLIYRQVEHDQRNYLKVRPDFSQDKYTVFLENIPTFIYDDEQKTQLTTKSYTLYLKDAVEDKLRQWLQKLESQKDEQSLPFLEKSAKQSLRRMNEELPKEPFYQQLVSSINICYDLTELQKLSNMRQELIAVHEDTTMKKGGDYSRFNQEMGLINQEYIDSYYKFRQNTFEKTSNNRFEMMHFTGKAFVSFQFQPFRDYFFREYYADPDFFKINGTSISVSQPGKPEDVHWFNMKITDSVRQRYSGYTWAVLVMLLIISLASLIGLLVWEKKLEQSAQEQTTSEKVKRYALLALSSLLTFIINKILSTTIEILSVQQKHKTESDRISSRTKKTIITQAINTCFIYVILYLIFPENPLGTFGIAPKIISLIGFSGGVVELLNNIFIPYYKLMDCWTGCGKCGGFRQEKAGYMNMVQVDLNKAVGQPEFPYSDMYSYYIIYSFVISFYGYLVPSYTLLLIVIFCIHYWVDKYNLFRRFSSPIDFRQSLRNHILRTFELCVFIFALSYLIWDSSIHFDSDLRFRIVNLINVGIASLYCGLSLFGNKYLKKCISRREDKVNQRSYGEYLKDKQDRIDEAKTYQWKNPVTSYYHYQQPEIRKQVKYITTVQYQQIPRVNMHMEYDEVYDQRTGEVVKIPRAMEKIEFDNVPKEVTKAVEVDVPMEKEVPFEDLQADGMFADEDQAEKIDFSSYKQQEEPTYTAQMINQFK